MPRLRRAILARLAAGECSVTELAEPFDMSMPAVSKHLGKWRFINRHPQGEAEFYSVYRQIAPPGRVVFTEIHAPFPDAESVVTVELTEEGGKTRLNAWSKYPSREVRDFVFSTGMEKGAGISYDRLDEVAMGLV